MLDKNERMERTLVHRGAIIDLYADRMRLPDGREELYDFIKHKGAAAVVPVLPDGRILMVRQYRNAIDSYTLEIPAGGLKSAEEPTLDAAHRELEEETGYFAEKSDLEPLISLYTTVAFCNEKIDIYVTTKLRKTMQHLDEDEYIEVEAFSIEELTTMIFENEIMDAKSIAALMTYRAKYC